MDGDTTNNRISALNQASRKKQKEALFKTEQAINKLVKNKQKITVRSVAREARVSVSYIYKYPELAYKIQLLRDAQKYDSSYLQKSLPNTNNDLKEEKNDRKKLLEEIKYLKTYIKTIESKKKSVAELQKENTQLQIENEKLKQELEFVRQNLAETREFILQQGHYTTHNKIKSETRKRVVKEITQDAT